MGRVEPRDADRERGREAYAERRWEEAFEALSRADLDDPLDGEELERLAFSAALTGRDDAMISALERLYRTHLEAGRPAKAAKAAFWIGFRLVSLGEMGKAGGWLGRSRRCVEALEGDCATRGWLMLPTVHRHLMAGDDDAALEAAAEAAMIGDRCGDADLSAFARNLEGRARMRRGEIEAGLAILDEVMIAAIDEELGPLVTGLVYCSVIASCHQMHALDRAREWTAALASWCEAQPQLVTFTGACMVHRAEVLQLEGAWEEAAEEARRASRRVLAASDPEAAGDAWYQQAEILRLRGDLDAAEEAYREASRLGREPQPGLALLRLAQGRGGAAMAALRRLLASTSAPFARARFLPAMVDVAIETGDLDSAREAAAELEDITERFETDPLRALATRARGAVALEEGLAEAAIDPLRRAFRIWQGIGAPYLAARARAVLARAYLALGDEDGAKLERDAAREVFTELGAAPDLADLDGHRHRGSKGGAWGLTPRELEVLRLLSSGETNKGIASALGVSERTIDRHVSNIFQKLGLANRASATAFAYEHGLI